MLIHVLGNLKTNWKAGLSVAMINIPLSISLAVASGATPLQWLLTGIWGWIFAAIFASSNFNVFWVSWALTAILITFSLSVENWSELLPYVAIMAWVIMLLIYFFQITKYITLIPTTALHGFLIWVGISIAAWQFNAAFGLTLPQSEKIYLWIFETIKNIGNTNFYTFGIFLIWFIFLIIAKKKFPKFPAVIFLTIVWVGLGYAIKYYFHGTGILLLSDKYTGLSFAPYIDIFSPFTKNIKSLWDFIVIFKELINVSLVVAIIAILETIISAQIAQNITKDKFSKQKEVFGLAISNIASWLFGGLPVTAVFVRTSLNIDSGAKSKYAAFMIGLFSLIFSLLLFNKGFMFLPYPIIAAILINIALWLINIDHLKELYAIRQGAFYIAFITAFFTVLEDATFWIIIGTLIALIIYLKKVTSSGAKVSVFRNNKFVKKTDFGLYAHKKQQDEDVILLKFDGGLNYLNQEKNIHHLELIDKKITIILSFAHMWYLDIDGIETINDTSLALKEKWVEVYFSGLDWVYEQMMSHTVIYKRLRSKGKVFASSTEALHSLVWEDFHAF